MADRNPTVPGTMIVEDDPRGLLAAMLRMTDIGKRDRQAMAKKAMAGRDPTLTAADWERVIRRSIAAEEGNQALERGVGELLLGQPVRAGKAIGKAYDDPSLPTVTNAGVQTALSVPTARGLLTAAKIGGAGLSAAAASDTGLLSAFTTPAQAGPGDRDRARAAREQAAAERARAEAERAKADADRTRTESERAASEQRLKEEREKLSMAENDAAVKRAIAARDTILADRPKKFSETRTGQVFDELGMVAPMIPAAIGGGLAGAGLRAAGAGHKAVTATGIGVGGLLGGAAGNWPLGHELMVAKPFNPEKEAYKAGAREMPTSDPRRAEWTSYAEGLPDENPARRVALNELLDVPMMLKRSALPALEGAGAGWAAVDLPGAIGRLIGRGKGSGPGNTGGGTTGQGGQGPGGAGTGGPQTYRTYQDLPPEIRQRVQAQYITDRALTGNEPPIGRTAQQLRSDLANEGINVPVTPTRVSETNKVVSYFVTQHGRLPTAQEFAQVFNNKTLALPATAGGLLASYTGGASPAEAAPKPDIAMILKLVEAGRLPPSVLREMLANEAPTP